MFKSNQNPMFRNKFSEDIFNQKYKHDGALTWAELSRTLIQDVCRDKMSDDEKEQLIQYMTDLKFIPGGRYLYYAGRKKKFFNNCYLLRALEDTREDWADLSKRAETCLATGGGIGVDYSVYRASGSILHGTGGIASGPISKMLMINEIGRQIMQGGSRRSAIYASLNHAHGDAEKFLSVKNWNELPVGNQLKADGSRYTYADAKGEDFNFPCPLDMTNISINYDTKWLMNYWETGEVGNVFKQNVRQALSTAEPGFSFNFFDKENETLRNACTEVTSEDDSDVCNLGSINLSRVDSLSEFADIVNLASKFLVCGTLVADLPYAKVGDVREKNRRLGLGLMGIHEWLIQRGYKYEVTDELHRWLALYRDVSRATANTYCDKLGISRPVACRAIAPTGTIGILAGTTTGIEPLFAAAYKRRYLKGTKWHYQYVVDGTAQQFADRYGKNPDELETALTLADDYERRIKFQADVQDYVDMSISSTINLPRWGSPLNNEDTVENFTAVLAKYAHRLRGFTCYPDGARGGQPLTVAPYNEAKDRLGDTFEESVVTHDICDITGHGGSCGV
jgi:ribonucleoside-diphosphate reductase alpha chain